MFKSYKRPYKSNTIWFHLKANTCSDFKNTNLFSKNYSINSYIYKNKTKYVKCSLTWTDLPWDNYNLNYWKYIFNINKYYITEFEKEWLNYKFCTLSIKDINIKQ